MPAGLAHHEDVWDGSTPNMLLLAEGCSAGTSNAIAPFKKCHQVWRSMKACGTGARPTCCCHPSGVQMPLALTCLCLRFAASTKGSAMRKNKGGHKKATNTVARNGILGNSGSRIGAGSTRAVSLIDAERSCVGACAGSCGADCGARAGMLACSGSLAGHTTPRLSYGLAADKWWSEWYMTCNGRKGKSEVVRSQRLLS